MLAYNFKKHGFQKSDHVREILAKLDAKQSKTGLSLYTQQHSAPSTPGGSPNNEEQHSFPNLKRARKKAKKRMTTNAVVHQSNQVSNTRSKNIPHRLPSHVVNLPPVSHGIQKPEERVPQPPSIPEQQFDKEKLDINANPFGYNRKTLAYQTRKINYVVEWPETWPFKITSFQRKKTLPKTKKWSRPLDTTSSCNNSELPVKEEQQRLMDADRARILAPVEHPVKKHSVISNTPYVESSLIKRAARKPLPKDGGNRFVLRSHGKDLEFASRRDQSGRNEDETSQKCLPPEQSPIMPEISREQIDSCPPSTPVLSNQDPVPNDQEQSIDEKNPSPNGQEPRPNVQEANEDQSRDHEEDVDQEASSLLNDIVNQIISEAKPLTI